MVKRVSLCGVGDTYTFGNDHNLMVYVRPNDGKMLYFPWDMDFSFSQSSTAPLVGDQNLANIINLPSNLRLLYAHMLDDINTTYNANYMSYWVGLYDSFPGQDWSDDLDYISQRGAYAVSVINNAGGNTPFSINGGSTMTVSNNLVTLSGTAPVTMTSILVNGISYPITWNSISGWAIQIPVNLVTNILTIQGYDLYGNQLTNVAQNIIYNGLPADPSQSIVFNEIMYAPSLSGAEYIELFNASTNYSFDLSGWRVNGLSYTFPPGSTLLANAFFGFG